MSQLRTEKLHPEFGASLRAAFTPAELRALADAAGLGAAALVIDSDRHMSLQIAA